MSEQNTQLAEPPASVQMFQFILGLMTPQAIHAAAKLGIADIVAKAPATADELAAVTKTNAASLRRLLRFLTSVGVFSEDAAGRYHQTPLSDSLRSNHPQSARGMAIAFGSDSLDGFRTDSMSSSFPSGRIARRQFLRIFKASPSFQSWRTTLIM